jgi:hypothetical protein
VYTPTCRFETSLSSGVEGIITTSELSGTARAGQATASAPRKKAKLFQARRGPG